MAIKDTDRKARANYKKKITTIRMELYGTDEDIQDHIEKLKGDGISVQGYIKRLIRADITDASSGLNIVRCKDCEHYIATENTESGHYCGMHSGAYEYAETEPDGFCNYGKRKADDGLGTSEPIIDRATYTRVQEKLKEQRETKLAPPPLGYKMEGGKPIVDEEEAEVVKRAADEMARDGNLSLDTEKDLLRLWKQHYSE
jgi:hypothetical protein